MTTALGHDPGNFYIWRASHDFAIHLSTKLVTQLTAQIARAGSQSRNGELRGILLGRTIEDGAARATVIEDFELIPADDDAAARQDTDDTFFEIALRKERKAAEARVVGFFRSRRDGRLNMSQRDLETFSRLFCETGNVALLIQTSRRGNESDAALFYWQNGGAHPRDFGFGFPFDAGQLVSGHPGWRYPNPFDLEPASASLPPAEPHALEFDPPPSRQPRAVDWTMPPPPVSPSDGGIRWGRLAPTIVLAAICIGALQLATSSKHPVAAASETSETGAPETTPSVPVAPAAPSNEHSLGLSVISRQHQLEIRWNRASAAIATSDRAVMNITDDGITEVVPFDQTQLRDGYVAYTPKTNDVSIRLEVSGKDGATTSESIRSVAIP
ncbi:MAG: hypothetical protein ACLPWF_28160 [Bryobacteraceae bacterium]